MKPELKRIEATLGRLNLSEGFHPIAHEPQLFHPQSIHSQTGDSQLAYVQSHEILDYPSRPASAQPVSSQIPVQAFPVQGNPKTLSLPRSKPPTLSSHRHAANPSLAANLLKEIEAKVTGWQQDLEQIIQQIRSLYEEGPIVEGWLESYSPGTPQIVQPDRGATLRHAEVDQLMDYIEEICSAKPAPQEEAIGTRYRLCGLDAEGQLWSRSCPAQQVPYVSLAIARYQKLRILLDKKQVLENRLQQLVQTLTLLHSQLEE
ncbi:MAG: hypothetical protein KME15_24190 [Drouetiella hepatica Uher 2000/2452]|jgi:hypothetical protein|uniref:Uncharacterized protein n=1 Tax=Drouetiella hepatica Uher 2000/2452 TaxID=904376 RepID=A0A951QEJ6_9CYAN|nr:hypothetical protein [Drouetiella hepatica Uher 2000/2452]